MGVASSRSPSQGPEVAQLLHAVKKGEHVKALRLLQAMPQITQTISQSAKASAVHTAVKRGHVSILEILRDLYGSGSSIASVNATSEAASRGANALAPGSPSSDLGEARSIQRSSRLFQQTTLSQNSRSADHGGRHPVERESWLNAVDRHGRTPLFTAVKCNRLEFVEGLVSLGADPWVYDRTMRGTALHLAAMLGHAPIVAALLKSPVLGPDHRVALCDAQDMYGFTPLHYAAAAGHADVARVLLDAGASYIAASQLLYDPSAGLRRLTNRVGLGFGVGSGVGREHDSSGVLSVPCAPRSNPLHLAALRGDGVMAMLLLRRFLDDTEGLPRAALERLSDPRTQLNKDGFQPYMLAGNAGHWHVAQLLIPHSRDDLHHLSRNRDRDFLIFFPLPEPSAADGGTGGEGPPSLSELAARVWAAKLQADIKAAEAAVRRLQHGYLTSSLAGCTGGTAGVGDGGGSDSGGGNGSAALLWESSRSGGAGGGVLGMIRWRSGRRAGNSSASGGGPTIAAGAEATASVSGTSSPPDSCTASPDFTPRSGGAAPAAAAPPQTSLSGAPSRPLLVQPSWPMSPLESSVSAAVVAVAPGSPSKSHSLTPSGERPPIGLPLPLATTTLCDVCFEQPQELALQPCQHHLCASCCQRVVEMHLTTAATAGAPGRRPALVPPRCPFCQGAIRGFAPAVVAELRP